MFLSSGDRYEEQATQFLDGFYLRFHFKNSGRQSESAAIVSFAFPHIVSGPH